MTTRRATLGSALFFLAGPGLEAGVGPLLLVLLTGTAAWPVPVRVLGVLLIVAGLVALLDVFRRFGREGAGTPSPAAPTQRLIVTGAYRHVRHPMYVATAAVVVGEGLLLGAPVLLVAAGVYLAAMAALSRWVEEPRLRARFGAEHDAYVRAVPGWIPRVRPWTPSGAEAPAGTGAAPSPRRAPGGGSRGRR